MRLMFVTDLYPVDKQSKVFRSTKVIISIQEYQIFSFMRQTSYRIRKFCPNFKNWPPGKINSKIIPSCGMLPIRPEYKVTSLILVK